MAISILLLGAGELGQAVTEALTQSRFVTEFDVSVLLRPQTLEATEPTKRAQVEGLKRLGVTLVTGDVALDSVDTLATIFRRFHTVISCTGFVGGPGTQLRLCRAALQAGIPRYLPWQFGIDYDLIGRGSMFDEQLDVRDLLRNQTETDWIIISCGMFTSFMFEPSFGVVDWERGLVTALGDWNVRTTLTSVEDIGRLTTEILIARPAFRHDVVYIAGDTVSYTQVADLVDHILAHRDRPPAERHRSDLTKLEADLVATPDGRSEKYRLVFGQGRGVAFEVGNTFNGQRSIPVITASAWVQDHLMTS